MWRVFNGVNFSGEKKYKETFQGVRVCVRMCVCMYVCIFFFFFFFFLGVREKKKTVKLNLFVVFDESERSLVTGH